jgi:hypothetical protein
VVTSAVTDEDLQVLRIQGENFATEHRDLAGALRALSDVDPSAKALQVARTR